ncbi:hypothetical protein [Haloterrigena alkaliphila]|uniref:Uncharacterized protein n=1 Tax=Haloterrigena alkaliphila TaxID=2816475 RepID=A0A8A2VF41_9EURY|nr:hypothetical protein [Haloterrigena alkaliphila]QSX00132.1 hypothetical protein J0X25_03955 [Haloterrigena alkaliphila]
MSSQDARLESGGFVPFYRSYTKTWIHAVATAGLTAFGTLTIVHRWFAALALASYVVPPVVLYLRHGRTDGRSVPDRDAPEPERRDADPAVEPGRDTSIPERTASEPEPEPRRAESKPDAERATSHETDELETADSSDETAKAVAGERASPRAERPSRGDPEAKTEPEPAAEVGTEPNAPEGPTAERESDPEPTAEPQSEPEPPAWHAVDAPTAATLRDVVLTEPNDTDGSSAGYAVGDGGVVLAGDGDEWTVVLEDGPAAGRNDLHGVDATADGEAVWVAGDSGALGRIDAETGRHTDYTAPEDITDNWLGVAVGGASGAETVLLIDGSGAVLRGEYRADGTDGPGLEWTGPEKPGSGSSLSGVALADDAVGYCCDTNDGVFETNDGGESFERVGLEGADGTLTDVATGGRDDCLVSADDGVVHRYDGGSTWTPERVADEALPGIDRHEGRTVACASDGAVHVREGAAADWERTDTGASAGLLAVSLGIGGIAAVGEDGTVVVRS